MSVAAKYGKVATAREISNLRKMKKVLAKGMAGAKRKPGSPFSRKNLKTLMGTLTGRFPRHR